MNLTEFEMTDEHKATLSQETKLSNFNRRKFLKISGIAAAGFMFKYPEWAFSQQKSLRDDAIKTTPQYLTPLFLLGSAARLAIGSVFIHAGLKHSLTSDVHAIVPGNAFKMGAVMPFGKEELLNSLSKLKDEWNSGRQDQAAAQRMALLSGALTHHQVVEEIDQANTFDEITASENLENKIYQDLTLISFFLTKGKKIDIEDAKNFHSMFRQMLPRTFTRFHTLIPDEDHVGDWVMNVSYWRQKLDAYYGEVAKAMADPDPVKVKKYITDIRFLEGSDAIIKRVSTFNRVSRIERDEAEELVSSYLNSSISAQALGSGYISLITINDYLSGVIQRQEVNDFFGI